MDLMPQGYPYQEEASKKAWGLEVVFPTPTPRVRVHSTRAWPALSPSLPWAQEKGPESPRARPSAADTPAEEPWGWHLLQEPGSW